MNERNKQRELFDKIKFVKEFSKLIQKENKIRILMIIKIEMNNHIELMENELHEMTGVENESYERQWYLEDIIKKYEKHLALAVIGEKK